ncbi:hypothetical protein BUALT_Bualt05G0031300 [Buddleja alternifolia]|uniref:ATP synthase F0 subunit 6 n=1 Tax=Buddleja alternifolia TaxID=168488 RepID=A0AAV6XI23_9LAMI|nr:hypothetical protein BUALT_Bualt05G0031300 [Buddleja alternifolia]
MAHFDLRYVLLIVINIVKSAITKWDPFDVLGDLTWTKFWFVTILLFIFSFLSIRVPIDPQNSTILYINVQLQNFSSSLAASFLASLFSPQILFWYIYPVILVLFSFSTCISSMLNNFVVWMQIVLSNVPGVNLFITTTSNFEGNIESQEAEIQELDGEDLELQELDGEDLEEGMAQG